MTTYFRISVLLLLGSVGMIPSTFGQGCKSLIVRNQYDVRAKEWNCRMRDRACVAKKDMPLLGAKKNDHYVCSEGVVGRDSNPGPLPGYHVVFVTSGCPECAVGWLYFLGERCGPHDLNCMD